MNTYAIGWAMAGNTPLKLWKQDTHGGGVRSPLIVRWPGEIAGPGGVRTQFHHAIDLTPTALEVTGMVAPETVKGVEQQPLDGESMRYTFGDAEAPTRRTVQYFEMNGQRALWQDGWKAVAHHEPMLSPVLVLTGQAEAVTDFDADRWELYHLDTDWNEVHDLADRGARAARRDGRAVVAGGRAQRRAAARRGHRRHERTDHHRQVRPGSAVTRVDRTQRWTLYQGRAGSRTPPRPTYARRSHSISAEVLLGAGDGGVLVVARRPDVRLLRARRRRPPGPRLRARRRAGPPTVSTVEGPCRAAGPPGGARAA